MNDKHPYRASGSDTRARSEEPSDAVSGVDPGYGYEVIVTQVYRCTCGAKTLMREEMTSHLLFGHPAHRNPALTCHATPMWDHERWCLRPKDHEGDHWTPSFNGGQWWARFYRCEVASKDRHQCIKRKEHDGRHEYVRVTASDGDD